MTPYPEKLVIEPTTRCNFKCEMCVKQSTGCEIFEGDFTADLFLKLKSLFPRLSSVIFTGIGEPLLSDELENFISQARDLMPDNSIRGFQTNGQLLTRDRVMSLVEAGTNKICISVDTVRPGLFDVVRNGGNLSDINNAFDALRYGRTAFPKIDLTIGIEFVLMKKNMEELPDLVKWAEKRGVNFIIVTHLTAYEKHLETQSAFLNTSFKVMGFFEKLKKDALLREVDISTYNEIVWKVNKSEAQKETFRIITAFKNEMLKRDLYVNLFDLLSEPEGEYQKIRQIFDRGAELAEQYGIELILPSIRPKTDRQCKFVEENTLFISWDGNVSPCYFLWHKYTVMRKGEIKHITPVSFGNINDRLPKSIWMEDEFTTFRSSVKKYDYPNCHAWCDKRCEYVLESPFELDCYLNEIPCCDCHWNLGLLNCLS